MKNLLIRINFACKKKTISIDSIDTKKIMLSSKESHGNKYFIIYDDYNDGIIPLYIRLLECTCWMHLLHILKI